MQKARSAIKQGGFSTVEILLASTVFGMIVTVIMGAVLYAETSSVAVSNRSRANLLVDEGIEALKSMKDNNYSNLTAGTYGLSSSSNQWALNGTSDTTDIFTRTVTITDISTDKKNATVTVSWPQGPQGTLTATATTRFTNWKADVVRGWPNPLLYGSLDFSGTIDAIKVATQGNYAYVIKNDSTPDFVIIDITNPLSPSVVGTLSLSGSPTNIAVSGNYAYVSTTDDSAELRVINVSNPTNPTLTGLYNAAGTGDGKGVFVQNNYVYLSRAANGGNDEFVIINVATPSAPVRVGGYSLNVTMYEVYVNGTAAYIATSSDTQEVLVINALVPGTLTLGTSINLPGTVDATTIAGWGNFIAVGQGTTFYTITTLASLAPVIAGSTVLSGTISDVAINTNTFNYAYVGTNAASAEFQVINISNTAAPVFQKSIDQSGSNTLSGVAYSTSLDVVPGASSSDNQEFVIYGPN